MSSSRRAAPQLQVPLVARPRNHIDLGVPGCRRAEGQIALGLCVKSGAGRTGALVGRCGESVESCAAGSVCTPQLQARGIHCRTPDESFDDARFEPNPYYGTSVVATLQDFSLFRCLQHTPDEGPEARRAVFLEVSRQVGYRLGDHVWLDPHLHESGYRRSDPVLRGDWRSCGCR